MAHKNRSNWSPLKGKANASPDRHVGRSHKRPTETYSFQEADDRMYDIFRNHGFSDYPHAKRMQLTRFYLTLMDSQQSQNFTRLTTLRETAIKHFIDCLMVNQVTDLVYPLLDVGTGPGFPGIPLKIDLGDGSQSDKRIILAEGVQKRVEFLKVARERLGLKGLDIIGRNISEDFLYPVQGVITRAVEDARNTLGNVVHSVQVGGYVYLMKGPNCEPEIAPALEAWGQYYELEKNIAYSLPQTPHERRLLVFRKIHVGPEIDYDAINDREDWSDESPSQKLRG